MAGEQDVIYLQVEGDEVTWCVDRVDDSDVVYVRADQVRADQVLPAIRNEVYDLINTERDDQDVAWGVQDHPSEFWMLVLVEEIGEAARAFLQGQPGDGYDELVQAAAVIVAWLESVYSGDKRVCAR